MSIWPQITYIVLTVLSMGIVLANHGRSTKHSAVSTFIALVIVYTILYYGGFFDPLFR